MITPDQFLQNHPTISHFYDDTTNQMVVPSEQLEQAMKEYAQAKFDELCSFHTDAAPIEYLKKEFKKLNDVSN